MQVFYGVLLKIHAILVVIGCLLLTSCHDLEHKTGYCRTKYQANCRENGRINTYCFNYIIESHGSKTYSIVSASGEPGYGNFIYLPACKITENRQ